MYRAIVIVLSDSSYYENKKDFSGDEVKKILLENGYDFLKKIILPDEKEEIKKVLIEISDNSKADLVLTVGGTGFSYRDVTPEATSEVIDKSVPGICELMRMKSYQITENSVFSRGISGIRKNTLIINLPGSPKASVENLNFVLKPLNHGLEILKSSKFDCANMSDKR